MLSHDCPCSWGGGRREQHPAHLKACPHGPCQIPHTLPPRDTCGNPTVPCLLYQDLVQILSLVWPRLLSSSHSQMQPCWFHDEIWAQTSQVPATCDHPNLKQLVGRAVRAWINKSAANQHSGVPSENRKCLPSSSSPESLKFIKLQPGLQRSHWVHS